MNRPCPLCEPADLAIIWQNHWLYVVDAQEPAYPGFCRVVWRDHQREMTDLTSAQRNEIMAAVFTIEQVLREQLQPTKINLASLGNQVPHLHWHIIPRFVDDQQFPDAIWASAKHSNPPTLTVSTTQLSDWLTPALDDALPTD